MKFLAFALIAAVTVNCLVKTINGKTAIDTLAQPYIEALLPPIEDVQDNNKDALSTKVYATAKATPAATTETTHTIATIITKKPTINDEKNKPSKYFLPPVFEARIEAKGKVITSTATTATSTSTSATTTPLTNTNKPITTTVKPSASTSNLKVPDLILDALVPPTFVENDIMALKDDKLLTTTTTTTKTATTQKPNKSSTKSYYQKQTQHFRDQDDVRTSNYPKQHLQAHTAGNKIKNYSKLTAATTKKVHRHRVAESQTRQKQVSLTTQQHNVKIDTMTEQYSAQHAASTSNSKYNKNQHNYSFDFYLGTTTRRPPKNGLPTITPFPHRLGR